MRWDLFTADSVQDMAVVAEEATAVVGEATAEESAVVAEATAEESAVVAEATAAEAMAAVAEATAVATGVATGVVEATVAREVAAMVAAVGAEGAGMEAEGAVEVVAEACCEMRQSFRILRRSSI
jgi:hypothetical protein